MFYTVAACLASYYFGFFTFAYYLSRFDNTPLIKDKTYEINYHYQQI